MGVSVWGDVVWPCSTTVICQLSSDGSESMEHLERVNGTLGVSQWNAWSESMERLERNHETLRAISENTRSESRKRSEWREETLKMMQRMSISPSIGLCCRGETLFTQCLYLLSLHFNGTVVGIDGPCMRTGLSLFRVLFGRAL